MKSLVLILSLSVLALPAAAATSKTKPQEAAPVTAQGTQPANPAPSYSNIGVVTQAAANSGVRQCLPRIDQVVNFLSAGATTGAMVFIPPTDPDHRPASIGLEVMGSNGLSYIDTTYAPSANGCDAMYAQVTYWENTCAELAKSGFPGFNRANPMHQHIGVLDGGPSAKVFLMPAGTGCVSIKKEVLF